MKRLNQTPFTAGANRWASRRWPLVLLLMAALLGTLAWVTLRNRQPSATLGPQQTVQTTNAKIGVHTRLTDEVEPWKIKRSLEMVREMGAPWIVEYFPWAYAEPRPGRFDWVHSDLVVDHAERQGLTTIARLGFVPEWVQPEQSSPLYLDAEHFEKFGLYAAEFAARYAGRVDYIIIWNEPNLALEWGFPDESSDAFAAKYAEMLRVVTPLIRAANPDVQILAGAMAPTLAPAGSADGIDDLLFLQQLYEAGAAPNFDVLAAHAYGWSFPPDEPPAPDAINFRRVELLREVMVAHGDGGKPVMITEGGWNDHPRWTRAVRPGQRIQYTLRAYELAQEWPWMEAVALWAFRYPWDAKSYQDYYTFVRTDFEPKPIYLEVQQRARNGAE